MKIDGQLIRAQLEVVAGAVSDLFSGRIWYDKTAEKVKIVNSSGSAKSLVVEDLAQTLTNKTIDADSNTITNIENADIKAAAAIAVNKLAAVTASRAVVSDASGFVSAATTTATEIGYVNGVTSAIQTQLDAKQARATLTTKGDLYVATANATVARRAVGTDGQVLTADAAETDGIKWATPATAPDQSYELSNLSIAAAVAANALTISLKDKSGSDPSAGSPVKIGFRSATAATGTYSQRSISAALSITVSSGSTLGHSSGNAHWIYIYALDNAGTVELAVSSVLFDEGSIQNTTAEGGAGAADSNRVMYSTTARTGVAVRLIGRIKSTQATAGTWASAVTEISLMPFKIERVCAIYSTNTATSLTTATLTRIDFEDKTYDNYNAVTTGASWVFTAPKTGIYEVKYCFEMNISSAWDLTEPLIGIIDVGGTYQARREWFGGNINAAAHVGDSSLVSLSAGGTVYITLEQRSGGNLALSGNSYGNRVSILEVV